MSLDRIVAEIDEKIPLSSPFSAVKNESWKRLCSLTHTGYQQIGARFTPEGLGYAYQESEILYALHWADTFALLVVVAFANLTENKLLALLISFPTDPLLNCTSNASHALPTRGTIGPSPSSFIRPLSIPLAFSFCSCEASSFSK